jgi:asparagine synthase (glutamine-hydrolysing)
MCGIAGELSKTSINQQQIRNAVSLLRHRGPEGEQFWFDEGIAFGHTRLCIIDLSERAAQPMHYGDRYTIIHNGELYNYLEIRKDLEKEGLSFASDSDTEVIVAAYGAWGTNCLKHFDGMFAFAIWDRKEKQLFAARDRMGEKPLFYYYDGTRLLFASELKALWLMGVKKEVNSSMLYNFLTIGYTSNPSDPSETFFEDVEQLPAASFLLFHQDTHRLSIETYWQVYSEVDHNINEQDAIQQFDRLLQDSVNKRLRSDVPVGSSLSGGLDSSTIVAYCSGLSGNQYSHKCFTAVFEGFRKSEEAYASIVAKKFNLDHHLVNIQPGDVPELMHDMMRFQEIPVGSASALAQYKVFEAAKAAGVTVLLDGQGADETLAGYHRYYKWYWQELYRNKKLSASRELESARAIGVKENFSIAGRMASLFPEFAASILQTRKSKKALTQWGLHPDFAFRNKRNLYYATPASFDLNGALYYNTFVNGLDELLRLADRNSMAHAVEVRLPFLGHELVEFLFTLPPSLKINQGWTKWILRKAMDEKLPGSITWRKDKTGFEPPQKTWMQQPGVMDSIMKAKKILAEENIITKEAAEAKVNPHHAYQLEHADWRYWSAAFLFGT